MTATEWSFVLSGLAAAAAVVANVVAVASFIRVWMAEVPTAEFLVTRDASDDAQYWLSVSNPSRRLIILEWIEVRSPRPRTSDTVVILPPMQTKSGRGETELAWEEVTRADESGSHRMKPAYLAVPSGETQFLHVRFRGVPTEEDEGFKVDFRLHWSKNSFWLYRRLITRRISLEAQELKARTMASFNHPSLPP